MTNFIISPSTLNLFIEEPALWVLKHYYKITSESKISNVRGKLVEEVVNQSLEIKELISYDDFKNKALPKILFDKVEISEEELKSFYKWGVKAYSIVKHYYIKEIQDMYTSVINEVTIRGTIDYLVFDNNSSLRIIDLKSVNRIPHTLIKGNRKGRLPKTKDANVRQQVLYSIISGYPATLLFIAEDGEYLEYAISKDDIEEQTLIINKALDDLKKLLTFKIEDVILQVYPKNIHSFFWDERTRNKAKELWPTKTLDLF